jgi:hypothetical protein
MPQWDPIRGFSTSVRVRSAIARGTETSHGQCESAVLYQVSNVLTLSDRLNDLERRFILGALGHYRPARRYR